MPEPLLYGSLDHPAAPAAVALPALSGGRLVDIRLGRDASSEAPWKAANRLVNHPLFEPERLKRLLRTLPRESVEIRGVKTEDDGSYERGPILLEADPVDTFERLHERSAWMLLHHTWRHDGDFGSLLREYAEDVSETLGGAGPGLSDLGCWLFLSSGRCVVHFHADPDQSLLNQIQGSKTVFVYPRRVLPETAVENLLYTGDQGAVVHRPEYETSMFAPTPLGPGESVFLPFAAPHRVINDDGVSISFNVGFQTRDSRRRRDVHLVNLELRRLGLSPSPLGRRPLGDALKARSAIAFRAKNRFFTSLRPRVVI
jgi:hypothetical protein